MPVELEEISLFGLFNMNGKPMQVKEEHFNNIHHLLPQLSPIPIDTQKIQRLGFLRQSTGIYYREQGSTHFILRPLKDGRWELYINEGNRIRIISYIHQVQRLWFALFDDHLFIPPSAATTKKPGKEKYGSGKFQSRH